VSLALSGALALVRAWTRVYTAGMHPPIRARRRAEIDSDLWEFHEDARRRRFQPGAIALLMLLRLALGVHDDLCWRFEHRTMHLDLVRDGLWTAAAASVALLCLVISALQTREPPLSPVGAGNIVRMLYPVRTYPAAPQRAPLQAPLPAPSEVVVHVTFGRGLPPPSPPPPPPGDDPR
jgi:hypothetical protein